MMRILQQSPRLIDSVGFELYPVQYKQFWDIFCRESHSLGISCSKEMYPVCIARACPIERGPCQCWVMYPGAKEGPTVTLTLIIDL